MKRSLAVVVLLLAAAPAARAAAPSLPSWSQLAPLPDREGFAYPFSGVHNGALLVAGGANFPDKKPWEGGAKVWYDTVFVLEQPGGAWRVAGKLSRPIGYGISLSTPEGVLCLGGSDPRGHFADGFLLRWSGGRLETRPFPALPRPLANSCGVQVGGTIYVAGGIETPDATAALRTFWAIEPGAKEPRWRELEPWPGPARMLAVAGTDGRAFFLFSGTSLAPDAAGKPVRTYLRDAYRWEPGAGWSRLPDLPAAAVAAPTPAPVDAAGRLLVLGGDDGSLVGFTPLDRHPGFPGLIHAYDPRANAWRDAGRMPKAHVTTPTVRWGETWIMPTGEVRPGVRSPAVWSLRVD